MAYLGGKSSFFFIHFSLLYTCLVTLILGQKSGHLVPPEAVHNSTTFFNNTKYNYSDYHQPTVFIAVLVRNKAHTLPFFLNLIEKLDYPKERLSIWIKSDHNEDSTPSILRAWEREVAQWDKYHSVSVSITDGPPFRHSDQGDSAVAWSSQRFRHIIRLKEEAIKMAKTIWADYIWLLDADAFIINNQTLKHLVAKQKPLVAPMLMSGGLYSNFWGGQQQTYYYLRTDEYKEIVEFQKKGCFPVPLINSAVLMDIRLREIPGFQKFNESIPEDDIILFAENAKRLNMTMEVCNDLEYGYILAPLDDSSALEVDYEQMLNLRTEAATYWDPPMDPHPILTDYVPLDLPRSTMGFDKVYMINLKRRPDRRVKMDNVMKLLGIDYDYVEAVDGLQLTQADLDRMGIKPLPQYRDPYSDRKMKFGEIGCFLSHYNIWKDMVKYRVNTALILEDDIHFEPYFVYQVQRLFEEASTLLLDWDLMYLGRKRSANANEPWVSGSKYIVHVDYSYWTLGYAITYRGAKKMLAGKPLEKLVPVDEYLPIMFNRHNNDSWSSAFPIRDVKGFSAEPLLLYPTHYTYEPGYISDTEKSTLIHRKHGEENRELKQTQQNCSIKDEL